MQTENHDTESLHNAQLPKNEERVDVLEEVSQRIDEIAGALLAFQDVLVVGTAPAEFDRRYLALLQALTVPWLDPSGGAILKALICGGPVQSPVQFLTDLIESKEEKDG
jgi:hypothetical protein